MAFSLVAAVVSSGGWLLSWNFLFGCK